ncbi:MAG: bifunctional UDP-N-acetylglucosamine diphosphorylase/glucosamine-1-phosphate N-acetyltransferase GlmU [Rhodobiaceae bacterium]|nr:bifunctional UDP-N-acetylglucosamine diphosphorylase/glucosamine-1-phosphate N-acetyltransferase GlmU [Rhodobiaceae bacterium]
MNGRDTTVIVLAAGKGTRMKSAIPKVMHEVAGQTLLGHVFAAVKTFSPEQVIAVVAPDMRNVADYAQTWGEEVQTCIQHEANGTGDAVRSALGQVSSDPGVALVVFGDAAFLEAETLVEMRDACAAGSAVVVLGFDTDNPTNYGRLICDDSGALLRIVEEKAASAAEKKVTLCNSGVMAISRELLHEMIGELEPNPASGEIYLTDLPQIAQDRGLTCSATVRDLGETVIGVDSRGDLATAEAIFQKRLREKFLANGVTLHDPESVYFCVDTQIGKDVTIEPNVVFRPNVQIGDNVTIKGFSHLEGVRIEAGAAVGPFARLRPGTLVGEGAKIGNFVETKKANIESGAKISHLTYIGDARVGAEANIGAGTITCNYDGFNKHFTDIGAGAFVGSNSSLVAPVKIGDGSYIGSGSVVTKDVTQDALAVSRPKQLEKRGWGASFREKNQISKEKKD